MQKNTGRIIKNIGGFCTVETPDGAYIAQPRGIFRHTGISPSVGDYVKLVPADDEKLVISEVLERKNYLIRPPLANLDVIAFVISSVSPVPNYLITDKLIAIAESKRIEAILVMTKLDLQASDEFSQLYRKLGYRVFEVNSFNNDGIDELKSYLSGKTSAFIGNSGVGKSTLLNAISSNLALATAETSKKLGRGRHTTRHAELYRIENDIVIADTPGFSTVDIERYGRIALEDIQQCFPEFAPYEGKCRFSDCLHLKEADCAITKALANGEIEQSRYNSYVQMCEQAKNYKAWEQK